MRAHSAFSLEDGISTVSCAAWMPLRIRVRKSAMGSVFELTAYGSPRGLRHARDVPVVGQLPEADATEPELAVHRTGSTAAPATTVGAGLVLRRAHLTHPLRRLGHSSYWFSLANGMPSSSRSALASSSVDAVVVIVMSIPRTWSIRS